MVVLLVTTNTAAEGYSGGPFDFANKAPALIAGSLAMLLAIRLASYCSNNFAADLGPGYSSK
jgi:hypothetical protein